MYDLNDSVIQRFDYKSDEASSRVTTKWVKSKRFFISPRFRISVVMAIVAFDILGGAAAAKVWWPEALVTAEFLTFSVVLLVVAHICGLYAAESSADLHKSARDALGLGAGLIPGTVSAVWFLRGGVAAGYVALAVACGIGTAVVGRLVCGVVVQCFAKRVVETALVIGQCESCAKLIGYISASGERIKIVGQIAVGDGVPSANLVGRIIHPTNLKHDLISALSCIKLRIDRVVIPREDLDDGRLAQILIGLEALSVPIHTIAIPLSPDPSSGLPFGTEWIVRDALVRPATAVVKRSLDLFASAVLIVLLMPGLLVVALLIRLETRGPVLFRQVRLGLHNRPFTLIKFRTMHDDAHARDGSIQAIRGDPRVTRVGAFLRKTSFDEVPQLLNVLNGSMSLVGPRPHPIALNVRFMPHIDRYYARHRVAPGITGWAQINGSRGETSTIEQMRRRIELDLEYIHNHTIAFDLWILFRTLAAVIFHRNAY